MAFGGDVEGVVQPDTTYAAVEEVTVRTSPEQDKVMQAIIDEALHNPKGRIYNLYGRNCAVFVEEVLRAGGLQVPYTILPDVLIRELKKKYPNQG